MYLPARYSSFHVVGIPIGADYAIARSDARARWAGRLSAQDVSIHAAGRGSMVGWPEGASCLYINFRAGFISQHAGSTHAPAVSLETHHTRRDRFIREIGDALLEAMTLGEPDRAGHAIVRTLGTYLVREYLSPAPPPVMLGSRALDSVMDDLRVDGTTSVTELARACGLTRAHFTRRFSTLTGESPHALALRCRVEHAKQLLGAGDVTIGGAACDAGFADQSHLSHTFRRLVGVTPARYRALHVETLARLRSTNLQ